MYSLHLLYEHDHVYFIPYSVYAMGHRASSKVRLFISRGFIRIELIGACTL